MTTAKNSDARRIWLGTILTIPLVIALLAWVLIPLLIPDSIWQSLPQVAYYDWHLELRFRPGGHLTRILFSSGSRWTHVVPVPYFVILMFAVTAAVTGLLALGVVLRRWNRK